MPESLKRPCSMPGCEALVKWGRCEAHARRRFVVCGPPGSGKTTWVRDHAEAGDLIWDLDHVLGAFSYRGAVSPGRVSHWITTAAVLCRETLVDWLGSTTLDGEVGVYVIVTKADEARRIMKTIGAELIELSARRKR